MDVLSTDPRTATIEGDKSTRRQLVKVSGRLLAELRPDERAFWVVLSTAGFNVGLAVLTDRRLVLIPVIATEAVRSVDRPFTINVTKKRIIGESVTVTDTRGQELKLFLAPTELIRLQQQGASTNTPPSGPTAEPSDPAGEGNGSAASQPPHTPDADRAGSAPPPPPAGSVGAWRWGHPVLSWRDAELMAGAHMEHLGFTGVTVTEGTGDGGLDAIAEGAAAQVKHQTAPTGSPDIQRLYGAAAGFSNRLFYASAYTPAALAEAKRLGVALFVFTTDGLVVAINDLALAIAPSDAAPDPQPFGLLSFEARQNRAVRWAKQVESAAATPISNSKRRGARQLADREQALKVMLHGLEQLQDSDNPLYKRRRKERTLTEAEQTLKRAAKILGVRLR